jgi:predicted TIM-barrel fold metal-dependent hydrolase
MKARDDEERTGGLVWNFMPRSASLATHCDLSFWRRAMTTTRWLLAFTVVGLTLALCGVAQGQDSELYLIDAHGQIDETVDFQTAIHLMDQAGIRRVILTPVGRRRPQEIVQFSRQYPGRVLPSVRTKIPAYLDNSGNLDQALRRQVDTGNFGAMAELLMYHAEKRRGAAENRALETIIYPSDPRVQIALQLAIEQKWPLVVHIEFSSPSIQDRGRFMRELEGMLEAHPEEPLVLTHMGQLRSAEVQRLIEAHPNIYFLTSRSDPLIIGQAGGRVGQPWVNMFHSNGLADDWKRLMARYPDRFALAFDNVWPEFWSDLYVQRARLWQHALSELPPSVAQAIAHGNAERLWKITRDP